MGSPPSGFAHGVTRCQVSVLRARIGHCCSMRRITYAGETVVTTDEVAERLVTLTAELAKRGQAEAITIPILLEPSPTPATADLVVGLGNDVLSVPTPWDEDEPDFSVEAAALDVHVPVFAPSIETEDTRPQLLDDPDFDDLNNLSIRS